MTMSERSARLRFAAAALLGAAAALLVSCGGTGAGLIPAANAGPLQSDFEEVAQAAKSANGNCAATEAAIAKTVADFKSLPSTVAPELRTTLQRGIAKLHEDALALCKQPLAGTTATSTAPTTTTTSPTTTPTVTEPTTSQTTSTTPPTTSTPPETTSSPKTGGSEAAPGGAPPAEGDGAGGAKPEGGK